MSPGIEGVAQEKAPKSAAPFRPRLRHRPKRFLRDDGFPVGQLLERFLIQPFLGYLLRDQAQCKSHSVKDGFRSRRTTRDIVIDRNHVVDASQHVVGVKPAASSRCTGTNCECELRVGNSLQQSPYRWSKLSSDGAANQDHIRVPGRPHELDPKTLGIIIRSENIDNSVGHQSAY